MVAASIAEPYEPYRYRRAKLPRGESHPLKRSELDAQLAQLTDAPIGAVTFWSSDRARSPSQHFQAMGWPGRAPVADDEEWLPLLFVSWRGRNRVGPFVPLGAHIWALAVPSAIRAQVRPLLIDDALPRAIAWIAAIAAGPPTRRDEAAELCLHVVDGGVRQVEA